MSQTNSGNAIAHQHAHMSTPALLFIGGAVRSGSTLFAGMAAAASDGFDAGELHLFWRSLARGRLCTCGDPLTECKVWAPVQRDALARAGLPDLADAVNLETGEPRQRMVAVKGSKVRVSPDLVQLRACTESAIREVTGREVIVDSSKMASAAVVASKAGARLTLVQLVRDPRAVAYSLSHPKPDPSLQGAPLPSRPAWRAALQWMSGNLAYERLSTKDQPVVRIRYEDFVLHPNDQLARLGAMAPLDGAVASGPHAIAGNPWRFGPPASLHVDDRWREDLSDRDRRVVETLTYPLRSRYGY